MWCPLPDPAQGGARSQALAPRSISRQRLALARQFVARSCQLLSKLRNEKGPQSEGGRQIADFVGEPCLQCIRQNALARTRPLTFGKPNKIHTLDAVSLFTVNGFSHEVKKHNLTAKADPNVGVFNLCSRQTGLSQQRIDVSALFLRWLYPEGKADISVRSSRSAAEPMRTLNFRH
jgi:hypothetical protein